jgi:hypothetical protein
VHANAAFLDNPEHAGYGFLRYQRQHAPNSSLDGKVRLVSQAKHDDSSELSRRVSEDVGKIEVQRHEHSMLTPAYIDHELVGLPAKRLFNDGMRIMSGGAEQR